MPGLFRLPTARLRAVADSYCLAETVPFVLAHLACLAAVWTGVSPADVALAFGLYALRMFGVTAGYHRYFSHRTFKTGRVFQFILAFIAQSSAQRGILWWAANHRHHHRFSDTEEDVHSPVLRSFWHAHMGWIFTERYARTELSAVPDLAKFPELVWLDRHPYLPAVVLGLTVLAAAGWSGLVVGFFWSTVAVWHATFAINSLAHVIGRRRYLTADQSRNNWWLALITFGEGWHNNHHHYQGAACQGFRWYEIDVSYYLLKGLAAVGLVSDLRVPPAEVVRAEQRLGRAVVEKAAGQLAARFEAERIVADVRAALAGRWAALTGGRSVESARLELAQFLQSVHLPAMPTAAEIKAQAAAMFVDTPSINDIVERARQRLIETVCEMALGRPAETPAGA
ncbi:acyl-CoA desaturase [Shumkonia mesophila]|uniref:acyl-CoA desaturase n=1 Tax=Shumkonia mesophila TaxID=2838854 RepID=UPI0029348432|nr:acyl-CoA desaturase [Shumkonia mesophila]